MFFYIGMETLKVLAYLLLEHKLGFVCVFQYGLCICAYAYLMMDSPY